MPRLYALTMLRRAAAFWFFIHLVLALLALRFSGSARLMPATSLALVAVVTFATVFDARLAREHLLIANFGTPFVRPALLVGITAAVLEFLVSIAMSA